MEVSVSTGFYGVLIGISEEMDHLKGGSCRVYGVLIGVPSSGVLRKNSHPDIWGSTFGLLKLPGECRARGVGPDRSKIGI